MSTAMPKAERYQNRIELLQGTLDLLILQTLRWGPQHGYHIAQAIRTHSSDALQVDTGSLYPRCTASSAGRGSQRRGRSPTTSSARASTGSRAPAAGS